MSLEMEGFDMPLVGLSIPLFIVETHPLVRLANRLPWEALLEKVLLDLQRTEKKHWWRGRPLAIRIHLGIYLLQQMLNLTDRQAEYSLRDNAAFQVFCGRGILTKWHTPDHTKIESFRSRLRPETQREIANLMAVHAVALNYACPKQVDIDSTTQEANIAYPSRASLLVKLAVLAMRVRKGLGVHPPATAPLRPSLSQIKGQALAYFQLKRRGLKAKAFYQEGLKELWRSVAAYVLPILKDCYQLIPRVQAAKQYHLRQAMEQLQWRGYQFLSKLHAQLFEGKAFSPPIYSFHASEVACFNKNKLNQKIVYGRAYQLGRIQGNFLWVGQGVSLLMPDARSLAGMVAEHSQLFKEPMHTLAVDKGYYSQANESWARQSLSAFYLPRPLRPLKTNYRQPENKALRHRRAGIEPLIGHAKQGGQLGRSRMKSDRTTLSAGYAAILGFNLRQLKRYILGKATFAPVTALT